MPPPSLFEGFCNHGFAEGAIRGEFLDARCQELDILAVYDPSPPPLAGGATVVAVRRAEHQNRHARCKIVQGLGGKHRLHLFKPRKNETVLEETKEK